MAWQLYLFLFCKSVASYTQFGEYNYAMEWDQKKPRGKSPPASAIAQQQQQQRALQAIKKKGAGCFVADRSCLNIRIMGKSPLG